MKKLTAAANFLNKNPVIRKTVKDSAEYQNWKSKFPAIELDGIMYHLFGAAHDADGRQFGMNPGADQLMEEDELILLWAWKNNLVPTDDADDNAADCSSDLK